MIGYETRERIRDRSDARRVYIVIYHSTLVPAFIYEKKRGEMIEAHNECTFHSVIYISYQS
jgi:hypothetical protein